MSLKRWTATAVLSMQLPVTLLAKPADLPIDQRINFAGATEEAPAPAEQPISPHDARAAAVFEQAERQQQRGELNEARRGYQEVHLLAPSSRLGQQAIDRLRDIETPTNDFAEEQEPPLTQLKLIKPTMQQYLEMLRLTQPLGAVPIEPDSF